MSGVLPNADQAPMSVSHWEKILHTLRSVSPDSIELDQIPAMAQKLLWLVLPVDSLAPQDAHTKRDLFESVSLGQKKSLFVEWFRESNEAKTSRESKYGEVFQKFVDSQRSDCSRVFENFIKSIHPMKGTESIYTEAFQKFIQLLEFECSSAFRRFTESKHAKYPKEFKKFIEFVEARYSSAFKEFMDVLESECSEEMQSPDPVAIYVGSIFTARIDSKLLASLHTEAEDRGLVFSELLESVITYYFESKRLLVGETSA